MTRKLTETTKIELENMVDAYGMVAMLEALAEITAEKSMHIQSNWQDTDTAKCWERVGSKLWSVATTAETYLGR